MSKATIQSHKVGQIRQFLWWCSTAEYNVLIHCPTDYIFYSVLGIAVLLTSTVSCCSASYFFFTLLNQWDISCLLGMFVGVIIFSIDRQLITTIKKNIPEEINLQDSINKTSPTLKSNGNFRFLRIAIFRLCIAVILGLLFSEPLVLRFFRDEVEKQIHRTYIADLTHKKTEFEKLDSIKLALIDNQIHYYENKIHSSEENIRLANEHFKDELWGVPDKSTGYRGYGAIAQEFKKLKEQAEKEDQTLKREVEPIIEKLTGERDSVLASIEIMVKEYSDKYLNGLEISKADFLTRRRALAKLIKADKSVLFEYLLMVLTLVIIDTAPVFTKLMRKLGSYDILCELGYLEEVNEEKKRNAAAVSIATAYYKEAEANDVTSIRRFFNETKVIQHDKTEALINDWIKNYKAPFNEVWREFNDVILLSNFRGFRKVRYGQPEPAPPPENVSEKIVEEKVVAEKKQNYFVNFFKQRIQKYLTKERFLKLGGQLITFFIVGIAIYFLLIPNLLKIPNTGLLPSSIKEFIKEIPQNVSFTAFISQYYVTFIAIIYVPKILNLK